MVSCIPEDSADPDVAGIGVLISFAISSLITILLIVIAYFRQALRPDRYNPLDKVIIRLGSREPISEKVRAQRIAALESFLKALSDQQLFTAFALTLTIYLLRYGAPGFDAEGISAYSYCLAVNIALLSSTVHLSATTILRDHFDKFKWLRLLRVIIMVVTIILLIPQLVFTQVMDPTLTLRCAVGLAEESMAYSTTDYEYTRTVPLATSAIILALVCGYGRRILELYSKSFRESPEGWAASVSNTIRQWFKADSQERPRQETVSYNERELVDAHVSLTRIMSHEQVLRIMGSEFRLSFFAELIWLLFYTLFSLFQMIFFIIWSFEPGQSPISLDWGFGQILPLVLLGLPVVSALEFYYEWESNSPENEPSIELQDMGAGSQTNSQDDDLSPYDLCLNHHRHATLFYTWLFVFLYSALVISGAFVFSWVTWGTFTTSDGESSIATFPLTLFFFLMLAISLGFSFWPVLVGSVGENGLRGRVHDDQQLVDGPVIEEPFQTSQGHN